MSRFTGVAPRKIMEGNLYFAFSFIIFLCSSAYAVDNLKINVDQDSGTFQISLSNQVWFNSGGVFARSNGAWHSTETVSGNGKLKLTGKSTATGKLDWGPMNIYFFNYMSDDKFAFTTYIVVFEEVPAVIFGQQWDSGGTDSSTGNNNDTISMWPTFKIEDLEGVDRGYMSWAGSQISNIPLGKFDSSLKEIHSRMDGGLPVAIFDSKMENTVVISPQNTFMSSHQQIFTPSGSSTPIFSTGILGSVNTVPKGYSMETLLVAGNNVTGTMEQWGRLLRLRYKKHDHYRLNDYSINYLGYYTDNGACYYYATDKFANYEEALIAVKKEADAEGIPYRYVQLDSWWYYKGMHNGVKNWTAMPSIFPRGIEYVANVTGWPIVAHNRYFSPNTDYASQNGGQYKFIIDTDKVALPDDPKFWTDLLSDARDHWNLYTYEQDWLSTAFSELTELQSELGLGERWLSDMAYAAKDLGLTIQYCMTYPRHALQSVTLPAVTQVRASADYGPGDSDWMIFDSSVLHHAIGLAPYKDTFHTETTEEGCKFTKPEPAPALMTYVSVLSGGPVGPSDTVNGVNKALIMATCAQDGLLLKPSRPALSLDSTFVQRAFGKGGPNGVVSAAYTEVSQPVNPIGQNNTMV